jgi:hypothetical protein
LIPDLSVIIPARNEEFTARTTQSVFENIEANTEVILICDGSWPVPSVDDYPKLDILYYGKSIGQRAAINRAASISRAKFVMKLDAHCVVGPGFDRILMEHYEPDWTVVPRLYNLHAFDWQCTACRGRIYQGPYPKACVFCVSCAESSFASKKHRGSGGTFESRRFRQDEKCCDRPLRCPGTEFEKIVVFEPKDGQNGRPNRKNDHMGFDNNLKFQYWGALGLKPEIVAQGPISDTMSLLGACRFMSRERFWELGGMDEGHGSWGQEGTEIACKAWLSGGRLVTNTHTWFSHMFRTQDGFSFPYSNPGVDAARAYSRKLWRQCRWNKAIMPLSAMVQRFYDINQGPFLGWTEAEIEKLKKEERGSGSSLAVPAVASAPAVKSLTKGVVYYTENRCPEPLFSTVQNQIKRCVNGNQVVSVSLAPIPFGENVVLNRDNCCGGNPVSHRCAERGILTMFKEILAGLEASTADVVFFCEHDVLYHPSHFEFTPPRRDIFYYNENVYKIDTSDGKALFYYAKQTAELCAYRALLLEHYQKRIAKIEQNARDMIARGEPVHRDGFSQHMGYEPGCHMPPRGVDNYGAERWMSRYPNLDVRHGKNLTASRWEQTQFRNQKSCQGWSFVETVPGWGVVKNRFDNFLKDVAEGRAPING